MSEAEEIVGLCAEATNDDPSIQRGIEIRDENWQCTIFPETKRQIIIYVPFSLLNSTRFTKIMYLLDGDATWGIMDRIVDTMIHQGDLEPMVLVFLEPGRPLDAPEEYDQYKNYFESPRNFEYDTVSSQFSDFIECDVLPFVKRKTCLQISTDPEDSCIFGVSSSGLAAMVAAWHRPDLIRRVISVVPSFVYLNKNQKYTYPETYTGGHEFPYMLRSENEKKNLRIWMQSGSDDLNNEIGDWATAFMVMVSALEFREYDFKYVFEEGLTHGLDYFFQHAPEILRWTFDDETELELDTEIDTYE